MIMEEDRRLIEETFPIKEISLESHKEDGAKKPHIKTVHKWWARRPLAASRATILAALLSNNKKNKKIIQNLIILSAWKNRHDSFLPEARKLIKESCKGIPKILDPFSGGGAKPLEGLRLGCETYAQDLNPVAVINLKSILEFPQKINSKNEFGDLTPSVNIPK